MSLSKHKWHKIANADTDLHWNPGNIAECTVDGRKICIARFLPLPAGPASAALTHPTSTNPPAPAIADSNHLITTTPPAPAIATSDNPITTTPPAPAIATSNNPPTTQFFAFAYSCPHAGAPLTDGYLDKSCNITCPVHNLKFNLRTGRDTLGEGYKLKTYPIEQRPDGLYISLDEGGFLKRWF